MILYNGNKFDFVISRIAMDDYYQGEHEAHYTIYGTKKNKIKYFL